MSTKKTIQRLRDALSHSPPSALEPRFVDRERALSRLMASTFWGASRPLRCDLASVGVASNDNAQRTASVSLLTLRAR